MIVQSLDVNSLTQTIYPGTNNIIDLSSTGAGSGVIAIRPSIDCYARMTRDLGALALDTDNLAGRGIALSGANAPGGTAAGIAGTSMDFGVNSIACEQWFSLEHQNAGDTIFNLVGNTSNQLNLSQQVNTSGTNLTFKFRVRTNAAATTLVDYSSFSVDAKPVIGGLSERPIHLVWFLKRTGNASAFFTVWVNQVQLQNFVYDDTASALEEINLSSGTTATAIVIGSNSSTFVSGLPGKQYNLRFYNMGTTNNFTDAMVLHRNKLGPNNLPTDGFDPVWRLSFNDRDLWASRYVPQAFGSTGSVVTTFNPNSGSTTNSGLDNHLARFSAGGFATQLQGVRCPANTTTLVKKTIGSQFMSLYATPPSIGEVVLTPVEKI